MISDQDKDWLSKYYPGLIVSGKEISGDIEFVANYNKDTDQFSILYNGTPDSIDGLKLSGKFSVIISERTNKASSDLPALIVKNIDTTTDRHFNQMDKSACLCSPLEEGEYLLPEFSFKLFLEELVIPFLYGQVFYDKNGKWPWSEYSHGAVGILESYLDISDASKARASIEKLRYDTNWPRVEQVLKQKSYIKGHTPCFCPKADQIRRCHPKAWQGINKLKNDIKDSY
ncbi:MAG: hypothetical protein WC465_04605 [Patescibacteria group bacterium]